MVDKPNTSSSQSDEFSANEKKTAQPQVQIYLPPDMEYRYKDVFRIFVGVGDVVIEFGNQNRFVPDRVSISDRIVMSVPNAYKFINQLQHTLRVAEEQIKRHLKTQGHNPSDSQSTKEKG
ncbi:MAG: hypothetical protein HQM11_16205 [SAR324 cluster bacterium]|nr:hypothetical protein [SAR324 cluster bacterium]